MVLTNAEKQRRYRQKRDADPFKRAEHQAKCRAKYQQDFAVGKLKHINDMTHREQRRQRKEWKKKKIAERKRKANNHAQILTPPSSPVPGPLVHVPDPTPQIGLHNTRRKKRRIAKCYRDNMKLKDQLEAARRLNQKLYVRLSRQRKNSPLMKCPDTPRTKTNKLLRNWNTENRKMKGSRRNRRKMKNKAKKTLMFQLSLSDELKTKYGRAKRQQQKYLAELTQGRLLKKYKLIDKAREELKMKAGTTRFKKGSLSYRLEPKIFEFYERDDNSKITPGMKDTVTKNGVKKQRRILNDTVEKLHEKFLIENTNITLSYTTFSRLRPFWVQPPKESDRDTYGCKKHENMQFLVDSLFKLQHVESKSLSDLIKTFSCDIKDLDCMYGKCEKCKEINIITNDQGDNNEETSWLQWKTKKEKRNIKGDEKEITLTVKETVTDSIHVLMDTFSTEMQRFKIHAFNIANQMKHYRNIKENLKPNEALVHVDFAENFQCKLANEIQSMHFGASKKQLTLHTGVFYTALSSQTFCAVSDSLDHNPCSVWAFMDPILDKLLHANKDVDTVHFFSDGPATQYKQKGNFLLFTHEMTVRNLSGEWNFHESGHGKGVPDGVGGALKRRANDLVLHGKDIMSAKSFVKNFQDSAVFVYEVGQQEIDNKAIILSKETLKPVPGTLKLHQISYSGYGNILYRDVSCTCVKGSFHAGHDMKVHSLINRKVKTTEKRKKSEQPETEHKGACNDKEGHRSLQSPEIQVPEDRTVAKRKYYFARTLTELGQCQTYEEILEKCENIYRIIDEKGYRIDYNYSPNITNTGIAIDERTHSILPSDIPHDVTLHPVKVSADGNCLPYSGSILVSGKEGMSEEIRVRIILESCIFKDAYLNQGFLERGFREKNNSLAKTFAFYSDEYANEVLSNGEIERLYEREVLKICKNKSYMGIWQVFALASVLCRPIYSVYPNLGNPNVRRDLHRMIQPREIQSKETSFIMWTTTRNDMRRNNWVPNHFIVLLPMEQTGQNDYNENSTGISDESVAGDGISSDRRGELNSGNEFEDVNTKEHTDNGDNPGGSRHNYLNVSDLSPQDLLGQYVLVAYDKKSYPGIVTDCDETEVFVSCMHRIGNLDNPSFYWPLAVRDECWYDMENVLGTIPEPKLVGQKYIVDVSLWKQALEMIKM